ncbi:unnamed protein product [Soboliphyme baturini]|uniref:Endo/exonuclease/phosphatase domain-containing protein n=1 Tax=Soboliphyme baturini TaxID=241478 RepID=A0A183INY8_9BILA|nr:unnamed protein product [Soboliphyme baturini]
MLPQMCRESEKDAFLDCLLSAVRVLLRHGVTTVIGNLNAKVGSENSTWPSVLGRYGIDSVNDNGINSVCLVIEQ